ncbi:hypothetical protein KUTeg_015136 [Tegillarca granosa]|uniref:Uncharacterized protein n=1 Tax=Tegillarca granosa TaxID=220873 RepID=A0ABQ9ESW4_TEGGR|nr:hypothetical protein KUTeg_015136 [Tegillarca granosa]
MFIVITHILRKNVVMCTIVVSKRNPASILASEKRPWVMIHIKSLLNTVFFIKGTVYVSKRPMCPLVDSSDSSRLSVGYCSKMKNQAFICQFNNTSGITEMCKNGTHIIENVPEIITSTTAASGTTTTTKTTTLLQTNDISNSSSTLNKESSISLTKTTISNLNLTYSPSYLKKSESQVVNTEIKKVLKKRKI